jgi:hypothetical protein
LIPHVKEWEANYTGMDIHFLGFKFNFMGIFVLHFMHMIHVSVIRVLGESEIVDLSTLADSENRRSHTQEKNISRNPIHGE